MTAAAEVVETKRETPPSVPLFGRADQGTKARPHAQANARSSLAR